MERFKIPPVEYIRNRGYKPRRLAQYDISGKPIAASVHSNQSMVVAGASNHTRDPPTYQQSVRYSVQTPIMHHGVQTSYTTDISSQTTGLPRYQQPFTNNSNPPMLRQSVRSYYTIENSSQVTGLPRYHQSSPNISNPPIYHQNTKSVYTVKNPGQRIGLPRYQQSSQNFSTLQNVASSGPYINKSAAGTLCHPNEPYPYQQRHNNLDHPDYSSLMPNKSGTFLPTNSRLCPIRQTNGHISYQQKYQNLPRPRMFHHAAQNSLRVQNSYQKIGIYPYRRPLQRSFNLQQTSQVAKQETIGITRYRRKPPPYPHNFKSAVKSETLNQSFPITNAANNSSKTSGFPISQQKARNQSEMQLVNSFQPNKRRTRTDSDGLPIYHTMLKKLNCGGLSHKMPIGSTSSVKNELSVSSQTTGSSVQQQQSKKFSKASTSKQTFEKPLTKDITSQTKGLPANKPIAEDNSAVVTMKSSDALQIDPKIGAISQRIPSDVQKPKSPVTLEESDPSYVKSFPTVNSNDKSSNSGDNQTSCNIPEKTPPKLPAIETWFPKTKDKFPLLVTSDD